MPRGKKKTEALPEIKDASTPQEEPEKEQPAAVEEALEEEEKPKKPKKPKGPAAYKGQQSKAALEAGVQTAGKYLRKGRASTGPSLTVALGQHEFPFTDKDASWCVDEAQRRSPTCDQHEIVEQSMTA